MRRLADFAPYTSQMAAHLADIAGNEVIIKDARFYDGQYGKAVFFDAELEDGKTITVVTSAKIALQALEKAAEEDAFPLAAKFVKKNKYWTIE